MIRRPVVAALVAIIASCSGTPGDDAAPPPGSAGASAPAPIADEDTAWAREEAELFRKRQDNMPTVEQCLEQTRTLLDSIVRREMAARCEAQRR